MVVISVFCYHVCCDEDKRPLCISHVQFYLGMVGPESLILNPCAIQGGCCYSFYSLLSSRSFYPMNILQQVNWLYSEHTVFLTSYLFRRITSRCIKNEHIFLVVVLASCFALPDYQDYHSLV